MNDIKVVYYKNGLTFTASGDSFKSMEYDLNDAVKWADEHPVDVSVNYFTAGKEVTGA